MTEACDKVAGAEPLLWLHVDATGIAEISGHDRRAGHAADGSGVTDQTTGQVAGGDQPQTQKAPSLWRIRDFRLVWGGGFVNDMGDWFLIVALPVYVFVESGSGAATAILFVVELAAALVLGPIGGSLVDRWDLRRTLVATNVAQALTLLPLLTVTGHRIWPAYLVVGAQAMLTQINNPASVAMVPRVVPAEQLTMANAAISTSFSLARLIGSPLGGVAVGLGGIGAVVVVDGASFAAVAFAMLFLRSNTKPISVDANTGEAVTSGVGAGLAVVRRHRSLRWLILLSGVGQIAQGFFLVLFVVFVVDRLDGGGVQVGIIRGAMAVGAIVGAWLIGRYANRFGPISLLIAGYIGFSVVAFAFWNAPTISTAVWIYVLVFGLTGIPGSAVGIGESTALQRFSPPGMLGRVVGLGGALDAVMRACGSLVAGLLVAHVSLIVLLDIHAAIYLGCGLLAAMLIRDGRQPVAPAGVS